MGMRQLDVEAIDLEPGDRIPVNCIPGVGPVGNAWMMIDEINAWDNGDVVAWCGSIAQSFPPDQLVTVKRI